MMFSLSLMARDIMINVKGRTLDNLTGENIGDVTLVLMNADSIPIDTMVSIGPPNHPMLVGMFAFKVGEVGKYIIHASAVGYKDAYVNFRVRSRREWLVRVGDIRMVKAVKELPELLVKATKIKMIYSGDTIVYIADAFKMADGSMLDELIRRLPGATLSVDGRIYVNGHYVENLLVNGKDFFGGNAQVALENLPAYTVGKIKVYSRYGKGMPVSESDMKDQPYTMDVRLKKEYSHGLMANAEVGAGTDNRYRLRGFGMDMKESSRVIAYGNANNVSESQTASTLGRWKPEDTGNGVSHIKSAGVDISHDFDPGAFAAFSTVYEHKNNIRGTESNQQTYFPGGDEMKRACDNSRVTSDKIHLKGNMYIQRNEYFVINDAQLSFKALRQNRSLQERRFANGATLNTLSDETNIKNRQWSFKMTSTNGINLVADLLRLNASLAYNNYDGKHFSLYNLRYSEPSASTDRRHTYLKAGNHDFNFRFKTSYDYRGFGKILAPFYEVVYERRHNDNMFYRLDQLQHDTVRISWLPSTADALRRVLDANNSYVYREHQWQHQVGVYYSQTFQNGELTVTLPLRHIRTNLSAWRTTDQTVAKRRTLFEPAATFRWKANRHHVDISSKYYTRLADLTQMIDYHDDSNPLYAINGNKHLKDTRILEVGANYTHDLKAQQRLGVAVQWSRRYNDVAMMTTFDRNTGRTTATPQNVNGNWTIASNIHFTTPVLKKQKMLLSFALQPSYQNSVDLASEMGQAHPASIVRSLGADGQCKADWNPSEHAQLSLLANARYRHITGDRPDFATINAADFDYGFSAIVDLPLSLQLSTSLVAYAHRGYEAQEMNTTQCIWNAELSRKLCRGQLLLAIKAFDILGQLKNQSFHVDAQGRTETWHNAIPRYAMISLAWRFNANPKR